MATRVNRSALDLSAQENNLPEIKRLLSLGADVNAMDGYGHSPLHMAAICNRGNSHFGSINLLLENGADVNAQDHENKTPLHYLIKEAAIDIVKLLLKFGADVNIKDKFFNRTPLFDAIEVDNFEVVKLLIDHGSDFKKADKFGLSPLRMATRNNKGDSHFEICELLLKNGVDVNKPEECSRNTPFYYLIGYSNTKIVQLFLDYKANVNFRNKYNEIPIFNALKGKNVEVFKLLLDQGSDISTVNNSNGSTLLHIACTFGCSIEIIKTLLHKGLDVNARDYKGRTPLMRFDCFAPNPNPDSLILMLNYADVNIIDSKGNDFLCFEKSECTWKRSLEHIAKMLALEIAIHPVILDRITKKGEQKNYFGDCSKELTKAKNIKLQDCWVTFFNLLVDSKRKLKNYAGNPDLIQDFKNSDCLKKFPIYGTEMQKNVDKAVKRRKSFDESTILLSNCLLIFNPNHLIVRDILDCLTSKDFLKLCNEN